MKWTLLLVPLLIGCVAYSADDTGYPATIPPDPYADYDLVWADSIFVPITYINCSAEGRYIWMGLADQIVENAREFGYLGELIHKLAADGEICAVLGHQWRDGRPGEGGMFWYSDMHPNTWFRTCRICGKWESKYMSEWE